MDPRVRYTKKIIEDTFVDLLQTKPLNKITVTMICEKAQINRGTFYKYYDNPFDLMEKLQEEGLSEMEKMLSQITEEGLEDFLLKILLVIKERKKIITTLDVNLNNDSFYNQLSQVAMKVMRERMDHENEEKNKLKIQYVIGGCANIILQWMNDGMEMEEHLIVDSILEFSNF